MSIEEICIEEMNIEVGKDMDLLIELTHLILG